MIEGQSLPFTLNLRRITVLIILLVVVQILVILEDNIGTWQPEDAVGNITHQFNWS